jgi:hypothetical protein
VPVVQADVDPLDPLDRAAESEGFEAFYLREYAAVVRLGAFRDWERIRQPSAWVRKLVVRRAGRTVRRRLLEAGALARTRPWRVRTGGRGRG